MTSQKYNYFDLSSNKIILFASGSGSNAENIYEYFKNNESVSIVSIWTNNPTAGVIERSKRLGIPYRVITKAQFEDSNYILEALRQEGVTLIVLAGFLWLIPEYLVQAYPDKIINIHPSLLPKYGGKGMYGLKVHQAVYAAGEKHSGITIHYVNNDYDKGQIIFQVGIPIGDFTDAEAIASAIHGLEYEYFPKVLAAIIAGKRPEKA